jgi:translation initiation factor IF-3
VRLVGPAGEQVGIVAINDALRLAQEADLDLVEVAPMARPPVCKLMDYGKFKYESALKARESRKNQAQTIIKEIKLRPKIDPHDYGTKKGHVERFLKAGDKVKVTIMFRGREQSRPELGFKLLQRLASDVDEFGFVESSPKQDGRNMIMVIGPHKRKADAMAAAKAERASRSNARGSADHDDEQLDYSLEALAESAADAVAVGQAEEAAVAAAAPAPTPAPARTAAAQPEPAEASPAAARTAPATPAPARPAPARPAARTASEAGTTAAPRPTAPARPQPRPGAGAATGAPKPSAPRTAAAATTAKPGPARRTADGPVPSPRGVDQDAAKQAAPAESSDSDS